MAIIRESSLGGNLGSALGSGIGAGLQMLAQQKLQDIQNQRAGRALQALGYNPELAYLPENLQKTYMSQFAPSQTSQSYPESPEVAQILQQFQPQSYEAPDQSMMRAMSQQPTTIAEAQQALELLRQPEGLRLLQGQQFPQMQQQQAVEPQAVARGVQEALAVPQIQTKAQSTPSQNPIERKLRQIEQTYANPKVNQVQRQALEQEYDKLLTQQRQKEEKTGESLAERKFRFQQEKEAKKEAQKQADIQKKEELRIEKENRPFYEKINREFVRANKDDQRLLKMEELIKEGNLPAGFAYSILKKLGLQGVLHPQAEEFEKLSQDFLKNAKDVFGSRITNMDIDYYLKTIPNLAQTDAGKMRVINNLKIMNEGDRIRKKAADDIIAQNNGKIPEYFESLVEKKAAPELDQLANRFITNVNVSVPYKTFRGGSLGARLFGQE